jgi:pimeloyl-ACP methyl ester carboxylesterase
MLSHREYVVSAAGYNIAIVEYGDPVGRPVMALHGWLDNAATFFAIGGHLSGIRLIAMDLVGHGRSDHRPAQMPYHLWDNVADIYEVMKALELKKADFVGHSMGASIAMLFAASFPKMVDKLLCIEGLGPLVYEVDDLPSLLSEAITKRHRMASRTLTPYASFEDAVLARMKGRWPVSREASEALLERGLTRTDKGYMWSNDSKLLLPSLIRFSSEQVYSFLQKLESEAIVIIGDEGASESIINRWLDSIEHLDVIKLKGGHHLHLDPPVAQFLADRINSWAIYE